MTRGAPSAAQTPCTTSESDAIRCLCNSQLKSAPFHKHRATPHRLRCAPSDAYTLSQNILRLHLKMAPLHRVWKTVVLAALCATLAGHTRGDSTCRKLSGDDLLRLRTSGARRCGEHRSVDVTCGRVASTCRRVAVVLREALCTSWLMLWIHCDAHRRASGGRFLTGTHGQARVRCWFSSTRLRSTPRSPKPLWRPGSSSQPPSPDLRKQVRKARTHMRTSERVFVPLNRRPAVRDCQLTDVLIVKGASTATTFLPTVAPCRSSLNLRVRPPQPQLRPLQAQQQLRIATFCKTHGARWQIAHFPQAGLVRGGEVIMYMGPMTAKALFLFVTNNMYSPVYQVP